MSRIGMIAAWTMVLGWSEIYACSATSVVDAARMARDSEAWDIAEDVAREVLDREGIAADVAGTVENYGTGDMQTMVDLFGPSAAWDPIRTTATPLEAAASTLLVEAGEQGRGRRALSSYDFRYSGSLNRGEHWVTTGGITRDEFVGMLDGPSAGETIGTSHAPDATVRAHMLRHANEYLDAAGENPAPSPAPTPKSPEPEAQVEPIDAPSAPPVEPAPVAIDHAG